ncbi:MAG: ATP-dependent sacrificial sulfur transferase LarE [Streptosporangiaceae bacterium]
MDYLTVGFDLDLTLVDSRAGIAAVADALSAESGVPIDTPAIVDSIGSPLSEELSRWFPPDRVSWAADRFRILYPELAVPRSTLLPGAAEAVAAVRRLGGRPVVVSAKYEPNVRATLEHVGLDVDEVVGSRYGGDKGTALREYRTSVYVGDHRGDIEAARAAGAVGVGVATGRLDAAALRSAGADVALADLTEFPGWLDEHVLNARLAALDARLVGLGDALVAFSGGADSAFVLAEAINLLGAEHVVAATAVSPSLAAAELDDAAAFAAEYGVRHVTPRTEEMRREGYRANAGDRCYFCKAELMDVLGPLAVELRLTTIATGTNADDVRGGFRPGIRAADERGAVTPLADAGLTKAQVREASRRRGLRTWDKPAAACLSSRLRYGIEVTPGRLARVERAEAALRMALEDAGIWADNLRVRDLGGRARVEVDALVAASVADCSPALAAVRSAGFDAVEVDPRGFRSGSMNELLPDPARYR